MDKSKRADIVKITDAGIRKLYEENEDFREYVEKHCTAYNVTKEEAFSNMWVKFYADQVKDTNKDKIDDKPQVSKMPTCDC